MKTRIATFINPRTKEIWICDNIRQRRMVDGVEFVEVHKQNSSRLVWINLENLIKIKNQQVTV